jgi:hypothetical protein
LQITKNTEIPTTFVPVYRIDSDAKQINSR